MIRIVCSVFVVLLSLRVFAAEVEWLTDFPKAQEQAKTGKKLVLMEFTGSDWCPPCKLLHKEVLTSKEFTEFARENLVLVEVDFPMNKPQDPELLKKNRELQRNFKVSMFPTLVVMNSDGKELGRLGYYPRMKASDYIAEIRKLQKKAS